MALVLAELPVAVGALERVVVSVESAVVALEVLLAMGFCKGKSELTGGLVLFSGDGEEKLRLDKRFWSYPLKGHSLFYYPSNKQERL